MKQPRSLVITVSIAVAVVVLCAAAAPAVALPQLQRERIIRLLATPVTQTTTVDWAAVGPAVDTNELLVELIYDQELARVYRVRAIEALAFFGTKRTKQVLWQLAYDRERDDLDRKLALRSLGGTFQGQVLFDLVGFLDEESAVLREGAVMGIGLIDDPRVTAILENRLYREETIRVRLAVERALQQSRERDAERARRESREILGGPPRTLPDDIDQLLPDKH
jgi:HEAT repeat protein